VDADGNGEIVTWGRNAIYVYRLKGNEILPYTRILRGLQNHFLNVDTIDLDGTGRKTWSSPTSRGPARLVRPPAEGGRVRRDPRHTKNHLVVLRGWNGKDVLAGQRQGFSEAFQGRST